MKSAKYHLERGVTWDKNCCSHCACQLVSLPHEYGRRLKQAYRQIVCPQCLVRIVLEINEQARIPNGKPQ